MISTLEIILYSILGALLFGFLLYQIIIKKLKKEDAEDDD